MLKNLNKIKPLILCLISIFLLSNLNYAEQEEDKDYDFNKKSPINASVRSLLLPGLGQVFNGQKTKGYIIAGVVGASFITAAIMYNNAQHSWKEYKDKYEYECICDNSLYENYKSEMGMANTLIKLIAAGWIYSIVDAYFFADKVDKIDKFEISSVPNNGWNLCFKNEKQASLSYKQRF